MRKLMLVSFAGLLLLPTAFSWPSAALGNGSGDGQGRTRCSFKCDFTEMTKNRLFLKLDVEAAMAGVPAVGSHSRNDDLRGQTLKVTVGTVPTGDGSDPTDSGHSFSQVFEDNGRIKTETFKAKVVGNGKLLHVDLRGLDLASLLPLNAQLEGKDLSVDVPLVVTATAPSADPSTPNPPTQLFSATVTFRYKQKANKSAKGSNF